MAEETITILKVGTNDAIKSINDLRNNVTILKKSLGDLEIGTDEYQNTLEELKVNQNALKDAMYATSASMDDLAASATGTAETYNGLVHSMAAMKEELRATDISTEAGKQRFKELADQINNTNDKLKEMDKLQGNFQRNVGNYPGLMKNFSSALDGLDKGLKVAKGGVGGLKNGFDALSATPVIAVIGIFVSVLGKLANRLKENEGATMAVQKAMVTLEPVFNALEFVIDKLAEGLSTIIDYFTDLYEQNKITFKTIIAGAIGVGNAIIQALLFPVKSVISAVKGLGEAVGQVFDGKFREAAKTAGKTFSEIGDLFKSSFDFKGNFETGQKVGEEFIEGLSAVAPKVEEKAEEVGKSVGKAMVDKAVDEFAKLDEELQKAVEAEADAMLKTQEEYNKATGRMEQTRINAIDKTTAHKLEMNRIEEDDDRKRAEKEYYIQMDAYNKKLELLQQYAKDAMERGDFGTYMDYQQQAADLEVKIETEKYKEMKRLRDLDTKEAKEKAKQQIATMQSVASATSSILGSIADMYENNSKDSEKSAKKVKALRIASATIDTISGAIGAYMQAVQTIPPPAGIIVGALQAATVTAAGIAQIANMKNTKVEASESAGTGSISAITPAPALTTEVSNVRSVTSASEEDRLNAMASDQRVYILASDIEASQASIKTQVSESSF